MTNHQHDDHRDEIVRRVRADRHDGLTDRDANGRRYAAPFRWRPRTIASH